MPRSKKTKETIPDQSENSPKGKKLEKENDAKAKKIIKYIRHAKNLTLSK